jgi:hypothetical protein
VTRLAPMPKLGPVVVPLASGQPLGRCFHCGGDIVLRLNDDLGQVMLDHTPLVDGRRPAVYPEDCEGWRKGGVVTFHRAPVK